MTAQNPDSGAGSPGRAGLDRLDHLGFSARRVEAWLWFLTGLGVSLRLLVYLLRPPIWTDEAKLAVSLLDRDWAGLLDPLAYSQIAPVLFMWIQKATTVALGFSEYSLRLVPLAAAVGAVFLMRHVVRRVFDGAPAILALAWFTVSYYPVRHAAELKPYATDLLAALLLTVLAVEWLTSGRTRWLWALASALPLAVALSYPAILAAAGILAALAAPVARARNWRAFAALAVGAFATAAAFAVNYLVIGAAHRAARLETRAVWPGGFPPLDDPLAAVGWILTAHTGRAFGYPLGGENGGSLLTFAVFAVGAVVLYRAGRRRLLAVLLLPFAAGIGAAVLQRYPYGGSGRVTQYLVPAICLLAGLGAATLAAMARTPARRRRAQRGVIGLLLVFALLLGIAAVIRPYRDRPDMVARGFARWFWESQSRDAVLVDAWEDLDLELARPNDYWVPGAAGFRINQRIYFERRRRGAAADLASVSVERPLRVVFQGSALRDREAALDAWLADMDTDHERVGDERYTLGAFAEQHGEGEWIRVLSFVPRRPG